MQNECLQTNVLKVKNGNFDEKLFHVIERSDNLDVIKEVLTNISNDEDIGLEESIIFKRRDGAYELFVYPVTGDEEDARIGR
jgi:hypothetical protein